MARAPDRTTDATRPANGFFAAQELLSKPALARLYTQLLIDSPTTVSAVRRRTGIGRSTAYKYANELAELGVASELDRRTDGAALWTATPVTGVWEGTDRLRLTPTVIAVYGASGADDDLALFVDRHGVGAIVPAVEATLDYLRGDRTRRAVADALDVPAVEGIAVSQAIERVVAAVQHADPTLGEPFETHDRVAADPAYCPTDG